VGKLRHREEMGLILMFQGDTMVFAWRYRCVRIGMMFIYVNSYPSVLTQFLNGSSSTNTFVNPSSAAKIKISVYVWIDLI